MPLSQHVPGTLAQLCLLCGDESLLCVYMRDSDLIINNILIKYAMYFYILWIGLLFMDPTQKNPQNEYRVPETSMLQVNT